MNNEQFNRPLSESENNDAPIDPASDPIQPDVQNSGEPQESREINHKTNTYTAVSTENPYATQGRNGPSQPLPRSSSYSSVPHSQNNNNNKKKGNSVPKILIALIAGILALVILLVGAFSALGIALVSLWKSLPPTQQTPEGDPSTSFEGALSEEEDLSPSDDTSNVITVPSENEETPPPQSYSPDSWYNPDDMTNDQLSAYEKVCSLCNPSIVAISTDVGSGSGVIWSQDGYIVTNHHVIDGAGSISVMLSNGEKYPASRIGTNAENDLALIRINVTGLLPVRMGDSDKLRMGQPVIAIGNALGILSNTATEGILSAITREITIEGQTMNLMQISAPINPGNSGGGCFDINGNLIGVVNAKTSAAGIEGLGFAIPVNTAKTIIGDMIQNDQTSLQKGLGITSCYEITAENYDSFKNETYIKQVERLNGGPLYGIYVVSDGMVDYVDAQNTFENGDILKSLNGVEITTLSQIPDLINKLDVGEEIEVTVIRLIQSGSFMNYKYALEEFTFKVRVIQMYK